MTDLERVEKIRQSQPTGELFADKTWRTGPHPLVISAETLAELRSLGRVLHQFNRAVGLLYRRSVEGKMPDWIAALMDQGKPAALIALQREAAFRNETPRVIRPDVLLTESGFAISELDSVPGGIGLTQWLNETYSDLDPDVPVAGGRDGMRKGFASIFGKASRVEIVVSEESAGYRPEMAWLAQTGEPGRYFLRDAIRGGFAEGSAVYRFFELFDLANVPVSDELFRLAAEKKIQLTPPPRPIFEEKLLFALLWNRNLRGFWRQELGEGFLNRLLRIIPQTWVMDPTPLPPHGAYPGLDITDWTQLKLLSQRDRELIIKVSGFSDQAWGARGVSLGSDQSTAEWSAAIDHALAAWPASPHVLQRYHKPRLVETSYGDLNARRIIPMSGRARLCPYYFVSGEGDAARPELGGILATICPADKKIIHGMTDAVMVPVAEAKSAG